MEHTISYEDLQEKIKRWTIYTEDQAKVFQNQVEELNANDISIIKDEAKICKLLNDVKAIQIQEQNLRDLISRTEYNINYIINSIEQLENQCQCRTSNFDISKEHSRFSMYDNTETLFCEINQIKELLQTTDTNFEIYEEQVFSKSIKEIASLMNKQVESLTHIEKQLPIMEYELRNIEKLRICKCNSVNN